jgi:hypothetical protein
VRVRVEQRARTASHRLVIFSIWFDLQTSHTTPTFFFFPFLSKRLPWPKGRLFPHAGSTPEYRRQHRQPRYIMFFCSSVVAPRIDPGALSSLAAIDCCWLVSIHSITTNACPRAIIRRLEYTPIIQNRPRRFFFPPPLALWRAHTCCMCRVYWSLRYINTFFVVVSVGTNAGSPGGSVPSLLLESTVVVGLHSLIRVPSRPFSTSLL